MTRPLVAIIDDDEALCSSLVDMMRSVGCRAEPFASAETFLTSSTLTSLECVIADVHMPGTGGLNLVRKLHEQGVMTPVILITALPEKYLDDEAISIGVQCLLKKPFETNSLLDWVERSSPMNALHDNTIDPSTFGSRPHVGDAAQRPSSSDLAVRPRQRARTAVRCENWDERCERWGRLMATAQAGESQAYEQLLREIDVWLCSYYGRRLPHPTAEDARQDALLAIHAKRHTYAPSRSFGAWVTAIVRYKWIDRVRDASRFAALSLDEEIPVEDHGEAAISAAVVDDLLGRLKPAQASVIRLVKLKGLSIARAAGATGQSAALVKVNIHRGLKKLAALVACDVITATTSASSSEHLNRPNRPASGRLRNPATEA